MIPLYFDRTIIMFLCAVRLQNKTQSKAGQSMNMEYFDNKLNGLITNKYKYKNTDNNFHYQKKKKKFIKDTKGTQLNPPWQSRITNKQTKTKTVAIANNSNEP